MRGQDLSKYVPLSRREYDDPVINKIAEVAARIEGEHYLEYTRLEEIIAFCREMGYRQIGIAHCVGLTREAKLLRDILKDFFAVARLRPNGASGNQSTVLWTASVERDQATLYSLGPTTLGCSVDAVLFRLTKSAVQPRSNDTGPLRRCSSISSSQVCFYCFAQHAMTRCRCDYWIMPQFITCSHTGGAKGEIKSRSDTNEKNVISIDVGYSADWLHDRSQGT
ncbi:MAG: DUF1847 domain-containing protein [Bacillota bacterium]|nr:DUF1847 domain-containing protein [Bacillota bacterium]